MGKKIWKWPWQDNELNCARYETSREEKDGRMELRTSYKEIQ